MSGELILENIGDWKDVEGKVLHVRIDEVKEFGDGDFEVDFEIVEAQKFFTKIFYIGKD